MIDVALVGCGGGLPISERYLSALMISYQGKKILIDCGEGTQVSLRKLGWGFKTIDLICITHIHGDHIYGLPGLLSTIGNSGRTDSITLIGPIGMKELLDDLKVFLPYLPYELIIYEAPDTYEIGSLQIHTLLLDHSSPCLGYRFDLKRAPKFDLNKAKENVVPKTLWNKLQKGDNVDIDGVTYTPDMVLGEARKGISISFITDTRPTKEIPMFIDESDLFICEGMYGDDSDLEKAIKNKHMTFTESAELARLGNVKELILTHFSPSMLDAETYIENATKIFENTSIGYDRLIKHYQFSKETLKEIP